MMGAGDKMLPEILERVKVSKEVFQKNITQVGPKRKTGVPQTRVEGEEKSNNGMKMKSHKTNLKFMSQVGSEEKSI